MKYLYLVAVFVGAIAFIIGTVLVLESIMPSATAKSSWKPEKNGYVWNKWSPEDEKEVDRWEKFKQQHPDWDYFETEIYRGTNRSVNRFYYRKIK